MWKKASVFFKNPKNMLWKYTKPKEKKLIINSRESMALLAAGKDCLHSELRIYFSIQSIN